MKYEGSCHCGAIKFHFTAPQINDGLRCNCSICQRKGAIMTAFTVEPENISITAEQSALRVYEFGSCVAKHYFCNHCGIYPFHHSMSQPNQYRINIGCVRGIDSSNLPFEVFNGASI